MSTTTWNSDLLSKGSIFSTTSPAAGNASDAAISAATPTASQRRLRVPRSSSSKGRNTRSKAGAMRAARPFLGGACAAPSGRAFIHSRASQGVTTKAMASDSSMPMLALMGIGLM